MFVESYVTPDRAGTRTGITVDATALPCRDPLQD